MPYMPQLTEQQQQRAAVDVFRGYDHQLKTQDGEWYDELNLVTDHYPVFSVRRPRSLVRDLREPRGILAKDKLMWIDGRFLYYGGERVQGIRLSAEEPKQMVSMGAYACIFPDGVYVNTQDLTDCGSMGAIYTSSALDTVRIIPCTAEGTALDWDAITISPTAPEAPANGDYWLDTSADKHALKVYMATSGMWVQVATSYLRIASAGIGRRFKKGDGVTLSGLSCEGSSELIRQQVEALNAACILQGVEDDALLIVGQVEGVVTSPAVTVERAVPRLDYVCEHNNRLWGCRYGRDESGKMLNEIHACALGDFRNWSAFAGTAADSYTLSVGTDGPWTGCISHGGYPVFFKEDSMITVYGTIPANYQTQMVRCNGVQRGSWRSLCNVNGVLFYKGRSDVYGYTGDSLPVSYGSVLGDVRYTDACGGVHGNRYYLAMTGPDGARVLFVYDLARGVWHKEGGCSPRAFAALEDELYILDEGRILAEYGTTGTADAAPVPFEAVTGVQGFDVLDQMYVSRVQFRVSMAAGSRLKLQIEYDSSGRWVDQGEVRGRGDTGTFVIPVIPVRCDHYRIRLSGYGDVRIWSMARMLEQGGAE